MNKSVKSKIWWVGMIVVAVWLRALGVTDADWSALGSGVYGGVYASAVDSSGNVYVGGNFTIAGGVPANNIAKWNGATWSTLGIGVSGVVFAIVVDSSGNVYAGGAFSTAGGVAANNIAKWNGSTWSTFGNGVNGTVYTIVVDSSRNVYAGGIFTVAGGIAANNIAKWDGSTWNTLGSGMSGSVGSIAVDRLDNLYAGGSFTGAGGVSVNYIAKWNGISWSALGRGMSSGVQSVLIDKLDNIYACGAFERADGLVVNGIAKWNGSTWGALGNGVSYYVYGMAVDSFGNLYAGGNFQNAGGIGANRIAKWNGTTWDSLGSAIGNGANYTSSVNSVCFNRYTGRMYVGGQFSLAGAKPCNNIASCKVANPTVLPSAGPLLLIPANGVGGLATAIVLNWNTVDAATAYQVQISTVNNFSSIFSQDSLVNSTSKYFSGLSQGVTYYWRVRASNNIGYGPWSATFHFSTATVVPANAPILKSPGNNTTGLDSIVSFSWNSLTDATGYYLQVTTDSTFSTISAGSRDAVDTSTTVIGLSFFTKYYWRVNGKNGVGNGPFSIVRNFTTNLNKPILLYPNALYGVTLPVKLVWRKINGAATYRVQISNNAAFSSPFVDTLQVDTSRECSTLPPDTAFYYWRVSAITSEGVSSAWSGSYYFKTGIVAPATPTLVSPINNAIGQVTSPVVNWNTVPGTKTYHVQVATDNEFTTIITKDSVLTSGTKTISGLATSTRYYWRVRAKNTAGVSAWSDVWNFTTVTTQIAAPTLLSPPQNASSVSTSVAFSWSTVTDATKYCFQISTSNTFSSIFIEDATLTSTSTTISGFLPNTIYYWRVKGLTSTGESGFWSSIFNFNPSPVSIKLASRQIPKTLFMKPSGALITYGLPQSSQISIKLYTLQGQLAATLYSGSQEAGVYSLKLPSQSLAKARYIVQLKAGAQILTSRF